MPVFLAAWVGPLLLKAAPWLAVLPGVDALLRWARAALYVAALGLAIWSGVQLQQWWWSDRLTPEQAAAATESARQASLARAKTLEIAAREQAIAAKEHALAERERAVAAEAAQIDQFTRALEADRARTSGDAVAVLGADDKWLRAWQGRRR